MDYFSAADFSGSVELRFVKCLPVADISDKYFDFDSVCGKRIATEIILFILSLISKRGTQTRVLVIEFFRDSK